MVVIVIYSILLISLPVYPPGSTPLTPFDDDPVSITLALIKSPKSVAFPADAVAYGDNKATDPVTSRGTCSDSHGGLS